MSGRKHNSATEARVVMTKDTSFVMSTNFNGWTVGDRLGSTARPWISKVKVSVSKKPEGFTEG